MSRSDTTSPAPAQSERTPTGPQGGFVPPLVIPDGYRTGAFTPSLSIPVRKEEQINVIPLDGATLILDAAVSIALDEHDCAKRVTGGVRSDGPVPGFHPTGRHPYLFTLPLERPGGIHGPPQPVPMPPATLLTGTIPGYQNTPDNRGLTLRGRPNRGTACPEDGQGKCGKQ
jgi:hypothetical protein